MGKAGRITRRYRVYTDKEMLAISFGDLDHLANTPFDNSIAPAYERKIRKAAAHNGWKIIRIQRLSKSVAETEVWEQSFKPVGYVHSIARNVVRNGQLYDLQCRATFIGEEVDRAVCRRFFNSFHIIGPPQ